MFWIRSSIIGIIAFFGYTFLGDVPSIVFNETSAVITSIEMPRPAKIPSVIIPIVEPPPTPVVLAKVQTVGQPLSDRSFPNTAQTPTPAPLNFINEDQFLWLASNTSWRPYLYPNDYKIFHRLWDIASCESGNENGWIRIDRVGDTDFDDGPSLGLMQINIFYWPSLHEHFNLFDPLDNLQAAWEVWNLQGWEAWSCYEKEEN